MSAAPIPGSYWVEPGRLLAGCYPSLPGEARSGETIERIRAAGIDFFLDLTEAGEYGLAPYDEDFAAAGVEYRRISVPDFGCPREETMRAILDAIDDALARSRTVYVHCYGGRGRTGTVVGCYLVRRGRSGDEALAAIADRRRGMPGESPETPAQRDLVRSWRDHDPR